MGLGHSTPTPVNGFHRLLTLLPFEVFSRRLESYFLETRKTSVDLSRISVSDFEMFESLFSPCFLTLSPSLSPIIFHRLIFGPDVENPALFAS